MVERRRGPQRLWRAMPTTVVTWSRRALLLGLAIGVVLMHHLVGSHQHDQSPASHASTAAVVAAAPDPTAAPTGGGAHAAHVTPEAPGPSPSAGGVPMHHPDGGGPAGATVLLHMCLAVLGAALVLVALAVVVSWWRAPREHRSALRPGVASLWRPPPVPQRLAQLQILRL